MADNETQVVDNEDEAQDLTNQTDSLDDSGQTDDVDYKALLEKSNKDRNRLNRNELKLKRDKAALEAKIQEYEDAKKSDLEKLQDSVARMEAENKSLKGELRQSKLAHAASTAGVQGPYTDYVACLIAEKLEADPEAKMEEVVAEIKESHGAFFATTTPQTPGAGEGGPTGGKGSLHDQIATAEKEINRLRTEGYGNRRSYEQIARLRGQIGHLKSQLKGA